MNTITQREIDLASIKKDIFEINFELKNLSFKKGEVLIHEFFEIIGIEIWNRFSFCISKEDENFNISLLEK